MTVRSFTLFVSYSQVAVFNASLKQPFSYWTESHVKQGFAWREGSASFSTIEDGGTHAIEVVVEPGTEQISSQAVRVVEVPFEVSDGEMVQIASISDEISISMSPGRYALRFECLGWKDGSEPTIRLVFTPAGDPKFRIIRADAELRPADQLVVTADPA
jgi:hypothetical protein